MPHISEPPAPPPLANWLTKWTITVSSSANRLYPNGRQQIELLLEVEPLPDQFITEQELASLRLMVHDADGTPFQLTDTPDTHGWRASLTRNEYDYYPQGQLNPTPTINEPTPPESEPAIYTRRLYVMNSSQRGGESLTVYAGITHQIDDEDYDYVSDGNGHMFNSSVDVMTEPLPSFELRDYLFEHQQLSGDENSDIQLREYYLGVSRLPLLTAVAAPAGMIQWDDRNPSSSRASHVGYAPPNTTPFRYNTEIQLGNQFTPVATAHSPRPAHITLVVQSDNRIPYDSTSSLQHGGPIRLEAVDVHGNVHVLTVRFQDSSPTGRLALTLLQG